MGGRSVGTGGARVGRAALRGRRRSRRGLTAVEVCLIFAIGGVLLAAGVPTFLRELQVSRISEAPEQLEAMYKGIVAYHGSVQALPGGQRGIGCLPAAAGPAPEHPSATGVEVDFTDPETPGQPTWVALGFAPRGPLRFRYSFLPRQVGCEVPDPAPEPLVHWRAEGDLDADGALSLFERSANLEGNHLRPDPLLFVRDRTE